MSIARFTHVSEGQYAEAMAEREGYLPLKEIPLPRRATAGSAGYDFVSPLEVTVPAGGSALIPTGVRAEMEHHGQAPQPPFRAGDHRPGRTLLPGRVPALRHGGGGAGYGRTRRRVRLNGQMTLSEETTWN